MKEICAQCRIEIAAGERTERDPECLACGGDPWWARETVSMTETEMREVIDNMPDLLNRPGAPKVLFFSSTADGTIPL